MNLGRLALRDLRRNPLRLALTIVATAVGVLAFIFLQTVIALWYSGGAVAQPDRLAVRNKVSLTQPLPLSYLPRIEAIPGVDEVTYAGWFGGRLSEENRDFFPSFYVEPESYLRVYDEYLAPPEQVAAWKADPCGAMIGEELAKRFGWKVGDQVTLKGDIFPGDWTFTVRGVYRGRTPQVDTTVFAFGYRCLNERLPLDRQDYVGYYAVRVDDPARSNQVAAAIDETFANTAYATKTESERSFQLSFIAMTSAILTAVRIISYVILVIILLVVGNTLAMGVRERTTDFATMRALGFRKRQVEALVLAESAVIGVVAAALGILGAPPVIHAFTRVVTEVFGPMPEIPLSTGTLVLSAGAAIGVALLAGLLPAWSAARLPIAEGLRRVA